MENKKKESQEVTTPESEGTEKITAEEPKDEARLVGEIESKLKELNDKYTRLYAEYDNYRRRTAKEKIELIKAGGEDAIISFLPIVDDMERAIAHHKENDGHKAVKEGLSLIYQKMIKILTAKGVKPMGEKGEVFNPDLHEAITHMPSEELKGKIIEVVEKGYTLNEKVIRHAKVVVGS
ncbi:MAG: nucleotide exchange factor GrpE [Bacteroidia bacterium]